MNKTANYNKEITTIYRVNEFLSSASIGSLEHLLNLIMEEATKTVDAEVSSIALYDKQKKDLYFTVALGKKGEQVKQFRIKLGQGIIGVVAKERKSLNIADVSKDKRFSSGLDKKTGFKSKSILAVPIIHKGKLIGALEAINKRGMKSFSSQDARLLEIVAGQAAIGIENAMLYEKILKKHGALKIKHRQLIEAEQKLVTMGKLSAIGNMASRIVHDFRNPLTTIKGFTDLLMLKKETVQSKDIEEFHKFITSDVDRLMGMTVEILDFAKGKSTLKFEECTMKDFMDNICAILKRDFENKNIKLIADLNYDGPVYMDKGKMQRVIYNIAYNARDVMSNGGTFKVETGSCGNQVEIKLSDTGGGIPDEIRATIFEPFATYGKSNGTGLGLAIVKKVVGEHNGTVVIESPPSPKDSFDTTFIIRFPKQKT
ncbi:MAG: GAF domain-containing sensor histidine kinase [Candidatus Omnitrophica bacterium]|nr:GAF domain-containing sensor histidine kinase [Candidatus Omnitrophota bacterium]